MLFPASLIFCQEMEWPTKASHYFSSNFGENRDDHFHMGLDIKTKGTVGHEVVAVEDGYVSRIVSNYNGYGKALYQKTISGHEVLFAHLDSYTPMLEKVWRMQQTQRKSYFVDTHFSPKEFQVKKGDVIGFTGNTGSSFGPHLHFEYRSSASEPLNPLTMAFDVMDRVTPIPKSIALVPLSKESLINTSPLTQTIPLYRDKAGIYHFADTISVFGDFALAINAVDKREGGNYEYQFHTAELLIDGKMKFGLNYEKISFSEGKAANTVIQFNLKRKNLDEYQKLYRLPEHPEMSIHADDKTGVIRLMPGYHTVEINIYDAKRNKATILGSLIGTFPMTLEAQEILRDEKVITLALSPKRGFRAIKKAVLYSFTPFGFADQKIDVIHTEQVNKDLHITFPIKSINNRILQIIGINELNGRVSPHHWTTMEPKISVIDIHPDLKISNTIRGVFFQVEIDQYVPAHVTIKLTNDDTFQSHTLNQVRPNTYLSEMLPHYALRNVKYIDVELTHKELSRQTRFHFIPGIAEPRQETVVFSQDQNCSIQTLPNTFYQTNVVWIDKVNKYAPVEKGLHLSPVYQLQPYDVALKDSFLVGIKYAYELSSHSNLGIYYYDGKEKQWTYSPTKNNHRKEILTTALTQMDAVTIIQDLDSPQIKRTFPANGGQYHIQDVNEILVSVDDPVSGIESEEASFDLFLNDNRVYPAYQPLKKEISYKFQQKLTAGQHKIEYKVRDRMGNESAETIYFVVY